VAANKFFRAAFLGFHLQNFARLHQLFTLNQQLWFSDGASAQLQTFLFHEEPPLRLKSAGICVSVLLLSLAVLLSSSCGGSSNTRLRFANMTPDEPSLDLLVDSSKVNSANFGTASGYLSVTSGSRNLQIEPSGTTTVLINQTSSFTSGTDSTIFTLNFASSISPIILADDNSAPSSGNVKIRIVNGSPVLGTGDVYVVPSGTDINTVSPTVTNLAFGAASTYLSITAGAYEILFTYPGQKNAYIDTGVLSLSAGQIRTVVGLNTSTSSTAAVLSDLN
jgi:hypothetical protein